MLKEAILEISCQGQLSAELMLQVADSSILAKLAEMEKEGILSLDKEGGLKVTAAGSPFIRNICRVFDKRMGAQDNHKPLYSKAI